MPTNIRIKGVVKTMTTARTELANGIPAHEADAFRRYVTNAVTTIEQICIKNQITPQDLPAPTYRAYQYLKSIDLDNLPILPAGEQKAPRPMRIKNLIAVCNSLQRDIETLATQFQPAQLSLETPLVSALLDDIGKQAHQTEQICANADSSPAHLPLQSQRAYQWLKFLSQPANLLRHLNTLATLLKIGREISHQTSVPKPRRKKPLKPKLYHIASMYRCQTKPDGIHLTISQGFAGAPDDVLRALVSVAYLDKVEPHQHTIRSYTETTDFAETLLALDLSGPTPEENIKGRHHNLGEVFARVNAEYFGGQLSRPRLTWNHTLSQRKMAHYQPATDTLMVSISLDSTRVPDYVIDFVMYHDLLHKKLDVKVVDGRRYAHTPEFHAEERKFRQYEQAMAFLQREQL